MPTFTSKGLHFVLTCGVIWTSYDWVNNFCRLSVSNYGPLAVDVIHGRGPINEMCQVTTALAINIAVIGVLPTVNY